MTTARTVQLHGLSRSLINNAVVGVTEGYTIKMEIFGVGYRVAQKGKDLEFALGYSHPILAEAPEGTPSLPMAPPSCPSPVLTSKSSDRSLRTFVVCVRMILTRARVSVTLASRSVARSERRVSKQWQTLKPQSAPQSVRTSPPDVAKHVLVATSASARPCVVPRGSTLGCPPPLPPCTSRSSTTWLATFWLQLPPWKLMCAHWKATRRLRHLLSAHRCCSCQGSRHRSRRLRPRRLQVLRRVAALADAAREGGLKFYGQRKHQRKERLMSDREQRDGGRARRKQQQPWRLRPSRRSS